MSVAPYKIQKILPCITRRRYLLEAFRKNQLLRNANQRLEASSEIIKTPSVVHRQPLSKRNQPNPTMGKSKKQVEVEVKLSK